MCKNFHIKIKLRTLGAKTKKEFILNKQQIWKDLKCNTVYSAYVKPKHSPNTIPDFFQERI